MKYVVVTWSKDYQGYPYFRDMYGPFSREEALSFRKSIKKKHPRTDVSYHQMKSGKK